MLRFLSIRNLAVIDRLELEFEPGLNVLTGETGAGKSILVGAVGLLVGGRASADLVRTGEDTAAVEAIFEQPDGARGDRPAGDLGAGPQPRVRRRRAGHQRGAARALRRRWSICTASTSTRSCSTRPRTSICSTRSPALDAERAAGRRRRSRRGSDVRAERERLLAGEREKASRAEFLSFQLAEIDASRRQPGEDEELAATRQVLANADRLQRLCAEAYDALYEGEQAALPALGERLEAARRARRARRAVRAVPRGAGRVKSQLEDLAFFLRSYAAGIDASPARLQEVEDRLALLERLKKKHGPTLDDVIAKARRAAAGAARPRARDRARRGARRRARGGRAPPI